MQLFRNLSISAAALIIIGALSIPASAATKDTSKANDHEGTPNTTDIISIAPNEKGPTKSGSVSFTDEKGNPIQVDTVHITPVQGNSVTPNSVKITDDKGNPIKLDSLTITKDEKDLNAMKSSDYTASDLSEKGSNVVNKKAQTRGR